jgi:phospholipid/cholesterol/gamma-HCH transport system substrate-binding protein
LSRSLTRWQALVLGAAVLLGVGLAVLGVFAVGSRGWFGKDALNVRAAFREVRGVEVGTRVRIRGIDAGEVVALSPPEEDRGPVILHLRLKGDFRRLVRSDSVVEIVSEGMIGGKVLEIRRGPHKPDTTDEPAADGALLTGVPSRELTDVLGQVGETLRGIQGGEGTLGKLTRDEQAYEALVGFLQQGQETLRSIQRDADAVGRLPVVGRYVEDPTAILVRPDCERNRKVFAAEDLFEPGRAVLTAQGRRRLDDLAPWLEGLKHKRSEVVVVAYADPKTTPSGVARELTRHQSEAVCEYLIKQHGTQKMTLFSSRKVTSLGQGTQPPPGREPEPLPPSRVEVIVFVPQ